MAGAHQAGDGLTGGGPRDADGKTDLIGINKRPLGRTRLQPLVAESTSKSHVITIPGSALMVLSVKKGDYVSWKYDGLACRIERSTKTDRSSRKLYAQNRTTVPNGIVRGLGLPDGGQVEWYLAALDGRWAILAGRPDDSYAGTPRRISDGRFGLRAVKIAESNVLFSKYKNGDAANTHIPPPCTKILGIRATSRVCWSQVGGVSIPRPCGRDERHSVGVQGREKSMVLSIPNRLRDRMRLSGGSTLNWYAAMDANGGWEVHVRPLNPRDDGR